MARHEHAHVYAIMNKRTRAIKLGSVGHDPRRRLSDYMVAHDEDKLEIVALWRYDNRTLADAAERKVHDACAYWHKRGEWFYGECVDTAKVTLGEGVSPPKRREMWRNRGASVSVQMTRLGQRLPRNSTEERSTGVD